MSATRERRQSERVAVKKGATLIFFNPLGRVERLICLVVDRSQGGYGLSVGSGLRRGQLVDLILDEDRSRSVRCSVVWIGNQGSEQEGQVGLQAV